MPPICWRQNFLTGPAVAGTTPTKSQPAKRLVPTHGGVKSAYKGNEMIDEFSTAEGQIALMKIPLTTVATLTGISATELSAMFNRQRPCPNEKAHKIAVAVSALKQLADELAPIPVDFRKSETLREVLERVRIGTLKVAVTVEAQ
jgi:hypothetical protein